MLGNDGVLITILFRFPGIGSSVTLPVTGTYPTLTMTCAVMEEAEGIPGVLALYNAQSLGAQSQMPRKANMSERLVF